MSIRKFETGPNPMSKPDYLVATKDGQRIICNLRRPDFETEAQMHAVAKVIEEAVSDFLCCNPGDRS